MPLVIMDARLAELAALDVLDVRTDGALRLNATFVAKCLAAYDADPSCLDSVIRDHIVARAGERAVALSTDPDELALAALEIESAEGSAASA